LGGSRASRGAPLLARARSAGARRRQCVVRAAKHGGGHVAEAARFPGIGGERVRVPRNGLADVADGANHVNSTNGGGGGGGGGGLFGGDGGGALAFNAGRGGLGSGFTPDGAGMTNGGGMTNGAGAENLGNGLVEFAWVVDRRCAPTPPPPGHEAGQGAGRSRRCGSGRRGGALHRVTDTTSTTDRAARAGYERSPCGSVRRDRALHCRP